MKRTFTERSLVSWSIFQGTTCSPTKFQEKVTLYAVTRIMFLRNLFERQLTDQISHFLTKVTRNAESDRRPFRSKLEFMDFRTSLVIQ